MLHITKCHSANAACTEAQSIPGLVPSHQIKLTMQEMLARSSMAERPDRVLQHNSHKVIHTESWLGIVGANCDCDPCMAQVYHCTSAC